MKELWEKVIDLLLPHGDWVEVYFSLGHSTRVGMEDRKLYRAIRGEGIGVGLRLIKGERTYYAHTSDISEHAVMGIAKDLIGSVREQRERVVLPPQPHTETVGFLVDPDSVSVDAKTELVRDIDNFLWSESRLLRQVTVNLMDSSAIVEIANSDGLWVREEKKRVLFVVNVVVQRDEELQTGREAIGIVGGWELFNDVSAKDVAAKALRRAVLMLDAAPAPAGKMPVVMSATAGGTIVHEAVGHGLEADIVVKESSVYANRLGQTVASELVTLIDDGTVKGLWGSSHFDGEGVKTKRSILIENGVLKGYMTDRLMSRITGWPLTGNGRRESFKFYPIPRMTNTFLLPGNMEDDEIVDMVKEGILVKKMGGGQVNPTTGDFVFKVLEGYTIKGGKIGSPIKGATIVGNGPEVLKSIKAIGKKLDFQIGTCGKDGQGVPVTDAQPTVLVPELTVGGTAI